MHTALHQRIMAAHEDEVHMSNERMVNQLRRSGALRSQACVDAFKAVDRAHFWVRGLRSEIYGTEVYGDAPLRYGKLHQSAPHIYARALEALMPLKTGMSFLNIGSGTGYFSSLVAEILGDGVNDGLELWPENVAHAQERCNMLGKHHITFNVGNVYQLDVNLGMRYSRIYIGACACPRAQYLYSLLEVGGILVGPFQSGHSQQLRRVIRESETHFKIEILNSVHFAALIEPPTSTGDMEQASGTPVPPPGTPVVGLPGVPFAFALRQKPWTVERNWAYPHSFRCITAVLLRSKNSSGLLPMELWIEHVLPWCPRWWFDQPSEIMTQKSALAMLGKRMSKVFFSTSTCSTASGISDEAEGAASGDEVHFTTVTSAPGATANATAPRAPPRRSMYRIATRAVRRCLRCVARCWTTSRSTPQAALQSPSDGETVPLDSRGVGTGEAEDEATQAEQRHPLGGVRWCLGSIVTPCTSLRRLLRRLVPV